MRDTSPEAERRYFELLRAKAPHERLEIAMKLTRSVRELAAAGIRARYPDALPERHHAELAARLYGTDVADRLFPGLRLG